MISGQQLSANADGVEDSAANSVNMEWQAHLDDAYAILRTLREPDERVAAVGNVETWERMVVAALEADFDLSAGALASHCSPMG
mgnify:CR=1 FL=1